MAQLLGIDIGTTATKALLIDEHGAVLGKASAEYPLSTPKPHWSEQDPELWWQATSSCLSQLGVWRPDAIGFSGQMHGAVFLDADGVVIRPAILWNDQRTAAECDEIEARIGEARIRQITRSPMLTGFQLPKLIWLRNHEPAAYARLRHLLLPKDFVRMRLSGELMSDVSDASGTGLFDVAERRWSDEIIQGLDLDAAILPNVVESIAPTGCTAAGSGLEAGVPIFAGGGDQAASAVGVGAVVPGVVSVSLGTSGVVFTSIERPDFDPSGRTHTFCHANGAWHAMGVMLSCGGALRWYRDTFYPGKPYAALDESASLSQPGALGATFLPYLAGERCPYHDPDATGAFFGLTLAHRSPDLARAVLEGVTFGLRDVMGCLQELGGDTHRVRVAGGGAKSAFWMQLMADILGEECVTIECEEGPALGAAMLAGVGVGVWPSVSAASAAIVREANSYKPSGVDYSEAYRRYRELYRKTSATSGV